MRVFDLRRNQRAANWTLLAAAISLAGLFALLSWTPARAQYSGVALGYTDATGSNISASSSGVLTCLGQQDQAGVLNLTSGTIYVKFGAASCSPNDCHDMIPASAPLRVYDWGQSTVAVYSTSGATVSGGSKNLFVFGVRRSGG